MDRQEREGRGRKHGSSRENHLQLTQKDVRGENHIYRVIPLKDDGNKTCLKQ